jgi:hypothetical protein
LVTQRLERPGLHLGNACVRASAGEPSLTLDLAFDRSDAGHLIERNGLVLVEHQCFVKVRAGELDPTLLQMGKADLCTLPEPVIASTGTCSLASVLTSR